MAKNIGKIFVQLTLEDETFSKSLSSDLGNAQATAKGIDASFRALGVNTNKYFDDNRKAAENAYQLIHKSGKFAADELVRAEEAKNAKIHALNEQQFGKQTSFIESAKKNWLALSAGAVAAFYAIRSAVEEPIKAYMESETALLKMGMAMKNQGDFTRAALADMEDFAKQVQKTTAYEDDATLAIMANLKSYGLSNEQVKLATQAALDLATAKANEGMTTERASEILGKAYLGIATGLKKVGIQIDETAPKGELLNTVMTQIEARFGGSAQAELLTYAGQWKQVGNQWNDIQEFLGLIFLKTIERLFVVVGFVGEQFLTTGNLILGVLRGVLSPLMLVIDGMAYLAEKAGMTETAAGMRAFTSAIGNAQNAIKEARSDVIRWTDKNTALVFSNDNVTKSIENMGKAGKRTQQIDEEAAKAAKKSADERAKMADNLYTHEMELFEETEKENQKYLDQMVKDQQKAADDIYLTEMEKFERIEKENEDYSKEAKKDCDERVKMERDIYKDIRGYATEAYDAAIVLIDDQAKRYREKGVAEVAVAAWVKEETIKAEIAKGKASDNWIDGVKAGLLELQRNAMTWGKASYDIVTTFASSAQSSLSSLFFDAAKGQLKSFSDYWASLWDTMLKKVMDILAQMLVEYGIKTAAMAAVDFGKSVGGSIGSVISSVGTTVLGSAATSLLTGGAAVAATGVASAGGAAIAGGASAGTAAGIGIGGTILAGAGIVGGALLLGSLLSGESSRLGAHAYVDATGGYGGYPEWGAWGLLPNSDENISSEAQAMIATRFNEGVGKAWSKIDSYISGLDSAQQSAVKTALAGMTFSYLPTAEGITAGWPVNEVAITSDALQGATNNYLYPRWLGSGEKNILDQINPVIKGITGGVISAKTGLDFVPYDDLLVKTHKGEAILPEREAAAFRAGKSQSGGSSVRPQPVQINLQFEGSTVCKKILEWSKEGRLIIDGRAVRANA